MGLIITQEVFIYESDESPELPQRRQELDTISETRWQPSRGHQSMLRTKLVKGVSKHAGRCVGPFGRRGVKALEGLDCQERTAPSSSRQPGQSKVEDSFYEMLPLRRGDDSRSRGSAEVKTMHKPVFMSSTKKANPAYCFSSLRRNGGYRVIDCDNLEACR